MRPGSGPLAAILLGAAGAAGAAGAGELLAEVADILAQRQLDPPAREEVLGLAPTALGIYLTRRDPYAALLSPAQYDALRDRDRDSVGIGVELVPEDRHILLIPYPDGPAWRAGLEGRELLLAVDGIPVAGLSAERVGSLLQGAAGAVVELEVMAPEGGRARRLAVTRGPFTPPSVAYLVEDGVPLLRIWSFRPHDSLTALERGIRRLQRAGAEPVIDLRSAQGGDLFEALDAASLFVDGNLPLGAIQDNRGRHRELVSLPGRRMVQGPALLLVGRGTASAAEAFARALRYHGAAQLVGGRTYGKCLTQTLVPLRGGGALKFSNGRLLGPGATRCESAGMVPDVPVSAPDRRSARELLAAAGFGAKKSPRGTGANH